MDTRISPWIGPLSIPISLALAADIWKLSIPWIFLPWTFLPWIFLPWFQLFGNHSPSRVLFRTRHNYKKYFWLPEPCVRTHQPLGGESVTGCKWDGGPNFSVWHHLAGIYCIVMWPLTSLPVFMMSLPVHESQNLYKRSEFVYWLRAVLTWHLKASRLALHRYIIVYLFSFHLFELCNNTMNPIVNVF